MLMLMIIETMLISMPKFKHSWTMNIMSILMMTFFTLSHYQLTDFIYNLSKNMMLDSLSFSMMMLSMWITMMMNLASYKVKKANCS